MSGEASTALVSISPSGVTPRERDPSLAPSLDDDIRPVIPVSMVVHGGTGILHGNMTNLTVNQYIGVVPDHGAWDSGKVKELMADAVKVSADANSQLVHPATSPTYGFSDNMMSKKGRINHWWFMLAGLLLLCIVPLVTTAFYTKFLSPDPLVTSNEITAVTNPYSEVEEEDPSNLANSPRTLPRSYWLAQPPRGKLEMNTLPVHMVVVSDTQTEECFTSADCVSQLCSLQRFHMDFKNYSDIIYNFMIGGDGNVYTGRGWDMKGAQTGTVGIALIGTFSVKLPKDVQVEAFNMLVGVGVKINKIASNYTLVNHCQLRTDGSYDLALAMNMTSWPHFDSSLPISRCAMRRGQRNITESNQIPQYT